MNPYVRRVLAAAFAFICVVSASGANASSLLLGFGDRYATSQGSAIHRGVDVACAEGDPAESLVSGRVTFAGRMPGGGSALAVTVESGDQRVTVSPLGDVVVKQGQEVAEGDTLGHVAAEGDPSTAQPHLHVSLRRGDLYLDPSGLLQAKASVEQDPATDAQPAVAPGITEAGPDMAAAAPPATAVTGAVAEGVSLAPVSGAAIGALSGEALPGVANRAARQSPDEARTPAHGPVDAVQIAEGVSLVSAGASPGSVGAASGLPVRARRAASAAGRALTYLLQSTEKPLAVFWLVAACSAAGLLVSRRALDRRLGSTTPVSDRFETLLQHARTGAKLCGLTSCSGLLPSQSRSRLAQRR